MTENWSVIALAEPVGHGRVLPTVRTVPHDAREGVAHHVPHLFEASRVTARSRLRGHAVLARVEPADPLAMDDLSPVLAGEILEALDEAERDLRQSGGQ